MKKKTMIRYEKNKRIKQMIELNGIEKTLEYLNITIPNIIKSEGYQINYHREDYTKEELQKILSNPE